MDIQTSPDPVARARELGAEIVAAADEIERTRRIPGRAGAAACLAAVPHAAAALGGRGETEPALYVAAIEELARTTPRRVERIRRQQFLPDCRLSGAAANHAIFADPRSIVAWDRQTLRARARSTQAIA